MAKYDRKLIEKIAANLKKYRKLRHLSQKELSKGICSQSTISHAEGATDLPNVVILSQICTKLGITFDILLENTHSPLHKQVAEFRRKTMFHRDFYQTNEIKKLLIENEDLYKYGDQEIKQYYIFLKGICETFPNNSHKQTKTGLEKARKLYEEALSINVILSNNSEAQYLDIFIAHNIALNSLKRTSEAYENLLSIENRIENLEQDNNHRLVISYNVTIGNLEAFSFKDFKNSNKRAEKVIAISKLSKTFRGLANAYNILAHPYSDKLSELSNYTIFHSYLDKCLLISSISHDKITQKFINDQKLFSL